MNFKNYKKNILILFLLVVIGFIFVNCENFDSENPKSYSQIGQDLKVLKHFNNKKYGYFIEVGANDGITLSNTYILEKDYNWYGICVEPVPSIYNKLKQNRKSINVPNAVYNTNDKMVKIIDANLLSGIREDIDAHKHILNNKKEVMVRTKTLTTIMNENNAPTFIDYLSIDTEGSELKILEGIDFDKYTFGYINIEHNYVEPRRTQMRKKLLENGYKYLGENKFDDIYVKEN